MRTFAGCGLASLVAMLLLVTLPACPGARITIVQTLADAGDSDADDPCARVCAKMAANVCPAGLRPNCVPGCRVDQAQGVGAQIDVGCILDASTKAELAACRVTCP